MVQMTEKQKYEIIFRNEVNKQSMNAIAKDMNITRETVTKWVKKYKIKGNLDRTKGSERKEI